MAYCLLLSGILNLYFCLNDCIDSNAFQCLRFFKFFARIVKLWKEDLGKINKKAADSLADPSEYENLFPEFQEALQAEQVSLLPVSAYSAVIVFCFLSFVYVCLFFH